MGAAYGPSAAGFQAPPKQRRSLTKPDVPQGNSGWDNENSDLIICVDDELASADGARWACCTAMLQGRHRPPAYKLPALSAPKQGARILATARTGLVTTSRFISVHAA